VFRPYWNVTDNIAAKEIFPAINRDPGYLDRGNYEIYSDHGKRRVRQKPGGANALGLVKFMFPNDFNIYLHDTPSKALFDQADRAASHGCIRLERPDEMAEWVLGWDKAKVRAAMDGADNRTVNLPKKIPVYIVYFTTYARDGQLYFADDLYGRDDVLGEQVGDSAQATPSTSRTATESRPGRSGR
jgi:murein L,D-transpeptidase YcbB/YkuD